MNYSGKFHTKNVLIHQGMILTDFKFSASQPVVRKKYVSIVEAVQKQGGEVFIFSSMHESGQRESRVEKTCHR